MRDPLARMECFRQELGELTVEVNAAPWRDLTPVFLSDAVTGAQPQQVTQVRVAWSAIEWRVLFHAADADAWATFTERDAPLYEEETVEVFFDPVGDLRGYFEIEVNPLGTVLDIAFRRNRSELRRTGSSRVIDRIHHLASSLKTFRRIQTHRSRNHVLDCR